MILRKLARLSENSMKSMEIDDKRKLMNEYFICFAYGWARRCQ